MLPISNVFRPGQRHHQEIAYRAARRSSDITPAPARSLGGWSGTDVCQICWSVRKSQQAASPRCPPAIETRPRWIKQRAGVEQQGQFTLRQTGHQPGYPDAARSVWPSPSSDVTGRIALCGMASTGVRMAASPRIRPESLQDQYRNRAALEEVILHQRLVMVMLRLRHRRAPRKAQVADGRGHGGARRCRGPPDEMALGDHGERIFGIISG